MAQKSYARHRVSLTRAGTLAHRPGAENRPVDESSAGRNKSVTTVYELRNSTVTVAETRYGPMARIERATSVEWAGPLSVQTVAALEKVTA